MRRGVIRCSVEGNWRTGESKGKYGVQERQMIPVSSPSAANPQGLKSWVTSFQMLLQGWCIIAMFWTSQTHRDVSVGMLQKTFVKKTERTVNDKDQLITNITHTVPFLTCSSSPFGQESVVLASSCFFWLNILKRLLTSLDVGSFYCTRCHVWYYLYIRVDD